VWRCGGHLLKPVGQLDQQVGALAPVGDEGEVFEQAGKLLRIRQSNHP
jgi:hypothetical protein